MSGFNPSQVAFNGGEISPRLAGRVDSELYQKALAYCRNFRVLPHGPLLLRSGAWNVAGWGDPTAPRLFAFRVAGQANDLVFGVGDSKLKVFDASGLKQLMPNLVQNGGFDANAGYWDSAGTVAWDSGHGRITGSASWGSWYGQGIPTAAGETYRLQFRIRTISGGGPASAHLFIGTTASGTGGGNIYAVGVSELNWHTVTQDVPLVYTGGTTYFRVMVFTGTVVEIDDVCMVCTTLPPGVNGGPVSSLAAPWTNDQLDELQMSGEPARNRSVFAHPAVRPQVIFDSPLSSWELYAVDFISPPSEWGTGNWPSTVELGYQGRLFLAATPNEPGTVWASRVGASYDFTTGALATDALSLVVSTKGTIEWLQAQKVMLVGDSDAEHVIAGSTGGVLSSGDNQITDESGFGSASVQAIHVGDQVLFVTPDRRHVRAANYDFRENAWLSKAITFIGEHLTAGAIRELHFAKSPDPTIFVLLQTGDLVACTYDRAEQVVAWWRIDVGGPVRSCCVANTSNGAELYVSVTRASGPRIERIPLHEVGAAYVDAAVTGAVPVGGVVTGLGHLEGETVRILVDGTLQADQVVAAGAVTLDAGDEGKTYVVGLAFSAAAKQLPLEGGLQTGSSQSARRRRTKVRLRLNNSAIPLVNGKRAPERRPADPMDTGTDLITGDVDCAVLGWSEDGALTIEQDLPFRTEILAVFGNAQANEV